MESQENPTTPSEKNFDRGNPLTNLIRTGYFLAAGSLVFAALVAALGQGDDTTASAVLLVGGLLLYFAAAVIDTFFTEEPSSDGRHEFDLTNRDRDDAARLAGALHHLLEVTRRIHLMGGRNQGKGELARAMDGAERALMATGITVEDVMSLRGRCEFCNQPVGYSHARDCAHYLPGATLVNADQTMPTARGTEGDGLGTGVDRNEAERVVQGLVDEVPDEPPVVPPRPREEPSAPPPHDSKIEDDPLSDDPNGQIVICKACDFEVTTKQGDAESIAAAHKAHPRLSIDEALRLHTEDKSDEDRFPEGTRVYATKYRQAGTVVPYEGIVTGLNPKVRHVAVKLDSGPTYAIPVHEIEEQWPSEQETTEMFTGEPAITYEMPTVEQPTEDKMVWIDVHTMKVVDPPENYDDEPRATVVTLDAGSEALQNYSTLTPGIELRAEDFVDAVQERLLMTAATSSEVNTALSKRVGDLTEIIKAVKPHMVERLTAAMESGEDWDAAHAGHLEGLLMKIRGVVPDECPDCGEKPEERGTEESGDPCTHPCHD